jgi:RNA polymerase sigma-70 factor (ECF subfamily)
MLAPSAVQTAQATLAPATLCLSEQGDQALVTMTLEGHYPAFEVLFRRYSDRVYAIAMGMMRNDTEAQDIVQETFLAAFRKLDTYRAESPFRGWLFRIATNASLMRLRTKRRRPELPLLIRGSRGEGEGQEREAVDVAPLASKLMQDRELGDQLHAAIDGLPEKYRQVLILADFEHRSMKEIGALMDLSVPAVKTRLHRARLAVRDAISAYMSGQL